MKSCESLESIFEKSAHLDHAIAMLQWDEATIMPAAGSSIRAHSIATLTGLQQSLLASQDHLNAIQTALSCEELTDWQRANLRLMERDILKRLAVPTDLVEALTRTRIETEQQWRELKPTNSWDAFAPHLSALFDLTREYACALGEALSLSPYDALIDSYSPGVTQALIDPVFRDIQEKLPLIIRAIEEKQAGMKPRAPVGPFHPDQQKQVCESLMQAIGFDFQSGRLDTSHHPFCGGDPEDLRITTRYDEHELMGAILGACHEAGHANYEFGLPREWLRQPVGRALGMTVHESQSLLIEMHACRSKPFVAFLSQKLTDCFGSQAAFEPETLYHYMNRVERSLVRVDADDVTYPLHVILRYDIEKALFDRSITVADLPEVWESKMQAYLGISPDGQHALGVMQDVHWPSGAFGYFPAYLLGRLLAAQLFERICDTHPNCLSQLAVGDFHAIREWLKTQVHQKASSLSFTALVKSSVGGELSAGAFLRHCRTSWL